MNFLFISITSQRIYCQCQRARIHWTLGLLSQSRFALLLAGSTHQMVLNKSESLSSLTKALFSDICFLFLFKFRNRLNVTICNHSSDLNTLKKARSWLFVSDVLFFLKDGGPMFYGKLNEQVNVCKKSFILSYLYSREKIIKI